MKTKKPAKASCQICGEVRPTRLRPAILVRPAIADLIRLEIGGFSENGWICTTDLQRFRHDYVRHLLKEEKGELTHLEHEVLESLQQHEILSRDPFAEMEEERTLGERLADRIAAFGGSWPFIVLFGMVVLIWMLINSFLFTARPFDPYPFILLNLVLSCIAALQAPIIMMSQHRQESRDRLNATHDYQVNLKAELEIRHLHQKMDHLISKQWERLAEIQEIQMDLINEIRHR